MSDHALYLHGFDQHLSQQALADISRLLAESALPTEALASPLNHLRLAPDKPQANLDELRPALRQLSECHGIDLMLQSHAERMADYQLACFDMDSTLIEQEVMDEIAAAAGIGEQVAAITEQAMRGEINFAQSFSKRLSLLAGFPANALTEIAESLRFSPGAIELVADLRARGIKIAVFSGGFSIFAQHLQTAGLGELDYIHANELEIIGGRLTGRISNELVDERRKAALIQSIAAELGIGLDQTLAVGDGANDIPMLTLAGMGIAYRAKPIVREAARFALNHQPLSAISALLG